MSLSICDLGAQAASVFISAACCDALLVPTLTSLEGCRQLQASSLCSPGSTRHAQSRCVPTQKLCRTHSPFSLQLHFVKRERAFPCSDDEFLFAPQNFSRFSAEIDN